MRNKTLIALTLAIVPVLSSCETIAGWLNTPVAPPVVVAPQPPVADPAPQPQPPAPVVPSPTIGDTIIEVVSGAAGAATGNPVIGIVVAGVLTALYGTFRGSVAKKAGPTENKV